MVVVIKDIDEFHKLASIVEVFHSIETQNSKSKIFTMRERLDVRRLAPHGYRTESGYFLQLHEGHPVAIWTPWGDLGLELDRCLHWEELLPQVLTKLSAKEAYPRLHDFIGMFGPLYALRKVGKQKLRRAVLIPYCKTLVDRIGQDPAKNPTMDEDRFYNMTKEVWSTLCTHYCFAHGL